MKPWSLLCSITAHLVLILVLFVASAWFKPEPKMEIIPLDLELDDSQPVTSAPAPAPEPPPPAPEPEPEPPEPEPEPPAPEPEPEPPAPEPPAPAVVAPPPEKPKPAELKKPEPKPVEKPKKPTLADRMAEAKKKTKTVTPAVQPKKPATPRRDISKDVNSLLAKNIRTSSSVTIPASSAIPGVVSAGQQNNYSAYMSRCVMPIMDRLWQQLGPNGLESTPNPVIITFYVSSSGAVSSSLISTRSASSQMNSAANALIAQLNRNGLPPFSTVGLSTERNAALPITITLKYER